MVINKNVPFLIVFSLSIFWTISMFVVPLTLPSNTVSDLDGRANAVDYAQKWDDLPPYHRAIYSFGDFNCHQKWYRSFTLNENQMPVDARMTSMFLFANFGFAMMLFAKPTIDVSGTVFNAFPKGFREVVSKKIKPEVFMVTLVFLSALPVAIDGFYQLLTPYESTNLMRILTGISLGWVGGILIGAAILSLVEARRFYGQRKIHIGS
jgi:uncharacterized membrane protein